MDINNIFFEALYNDATGRDKKAAKKANEVIDLMYEDTYKAWLIYCKGRIKTEIDEGQ